MNDGVVTPEGGGAPAAVLLEYTPTEEEFVESCLWASREAIRWKAVIQLFSGLAYGLIAWLVLPQPPLLAAAMFAIAAGHFVDAALARDGAAALQGRASPPTSRGQRLVGSGQSRRSRDG